MKLNDAGTREVCGRQQAQAQLDITHRKKAFWSVQNVVEESYTRPVTWQCCG